MFSRIPSQTTMEKRKESTDGTSSSACSLDTASTCQQVELEVDLPSDQEQLKIDLGQVETFNNEDVRSDSDVRSEEETVSSDTSGPLNQSVDSILDYLGQFGR